MTHYTQADVEMADRHIAEGEVHIANQKALLARLRLQSLPTEDAENMLDLLNSIMVEHYAHRTAILVALGSASIE